MAEKTGRIIPWARLSQVSEKYKVEDFPMVSVVIPSHNESHSLEITLESVVAQKYPNFEIIIIDCSEDRSLEIIRSFQFDHLFINSVACASRYQLMNKGISQAKGEYISFLFPGDFFVYSETLKEIMALALEKNKPELVYGGTLLRDGQGEARLLYRQLTLQGLKKGEQPTSLQSCWFKTSSIKELGKFDSHYTMRGGFDLLCRFCLKFPPQQGNHVASVKRVLTDFDLRFFTRQMVIDHFKETFTIIRKHFGVWAALRWLIFYQKDLSRLIALWWRSVRVAFSGKYPVR